MNIRYPRPSGRGSIEASALTSAESRRMTYPRPSGRGSIEAQMSRRSLINAINYPRPSGRGSIEADIYVRQFRTVLDPIHVHQDVAPLKLPSKFRALRALQIYPRPSGRGSIEARGRLSGNWRRITLSTSIRTWLH